MGATDARERQAYDIARQIDQARRSLRMAQNQRMLDWRFSAEAGQLRREVATARLRVAVASRAVLDHVRMGMPYQRKYLQVLSAEQELEQARTAGAAPQRITSLAARLLALRSELRELERLALDGSDEVRLAREQWLERARLYAELRRDAHQAVMADQSWQAARQRLSAARAQLDAMPPP